LSKFEENEDREGFEKEIIEVKVRFNLTLSREEKLFAA
jgi:predicted Ser/Thr protein kinase